jgi:hypothetical protein
MKSIGTILLLLILLVSVSQNRTTAGEHRTSEALWGTPVPYEILQRPSHHSQKSMPVDQAILQGNPVRPYSYGWFGTNPSPHWQRQFGYSRSYTQWTLK